MSGPRLHDYPGTEWRFSYPETSLREPGSERRGIPPSGLQGQGCPSVVPLHQTLGLAASKLHLPALDEPERVRLHRIPHPASRIPCQPTQGDRKSTRLNSSHGYISYAVFCLKKKKKKKIE